MDMICFAGYTVMCVRALYLLVASNSSAEVLQGWPPGVPAAARHMPCWPLGYVTVWVAMVGFIALLRSYMSVGTAVLALGVRCGTFWAPRSRHSWLLLVAPCLLASMRFTRANGPCSLHWFGVTSLHALFYAGPSLLLARALCAERFFGLLRCAFPR